MCTGLNRYWFRAPLWYTTRFPSLVLVCHVSRRIHSKHRENHDNSSSYAFMLFHANCVVPIRRRRAVHRPCVEGYFR